MYVIFKCNFPCSGEKLKLSYVGNNTSCRICSYIVGKHLPSVKRKFVFQIDISVPDGEVYVLKSTKLPELSEFFVGGPKILNFENDSLPTSRLCLIKICFTAIYFFVFL